MLSAVCGARVAKHHFTDMDETRADGDDDDEGGNSEDDHGEYEDGSGSAGDGTVSQTKRRQARSFYFTTGAVKFFLIFSP